MQQVNFFFTKSPSVKCLDDLAVKWNMPKVSSTACSEESERYKNILLGFQCLN
jgi:hypothetical protein